MAYLEDNSVWVKKGAILKVQPRAQSQSKLS